MTQAEVNKPNWIQWTSLVIVAVLLIGGAVIYSDVKSAELKAEQAQASADAAKNAVNSAVSNIPTASEIAALVQIPAVPASDPTISSGVGRLCSLTNDCANCFDFAYDHSTTADNYMSSTGYRNLKKAVSGITGINELEDYDSFSVSKLDRYATAVNCNEGDDGDYQVELLYRINYREVDATPWIDNEVIYVSVVVEVTDNIDSEVISTTQVDRHYEITKSE